MLAILLDNALKYSGKDGGISVKIKFHLIEVRYNTMGIRESDIPHIFDRFCRADMSRTKNKIEGYGLGLAIAKNIVEAHKGKIEVESEVGKGSTFKVIL